ncbi:hypothetical protein QCA50_014882 [Cerrena zonata]|uniref:G protein-coupled receptor n=1 Tax=Cerrena zonata TaxID=2478898 RepID=A0AAW0FSS0_9APHY
MSLDSSTDPIQLVFFYQVTNYIAVATFALLAYDFLLGFFEDIHILSIRPPKLPDVIYIISRLLAIAEASANCITTSLSPTSCIRYRLLLAGQIVLAVIIPCNSWLFLLRIRAIPNHFRSRTTLIICTLLWTSTFTSFLVFPGYKFINLPTADGRCEGEIEYNGALLCVPFIALVVFDTATMTAILVGFAIHSPDSSWAAKIQSVISVKHLGHLSGVFVRSGLIYYMATIFIHLSMVIIISSSALATPPIGELNIMINVFHTIMTCRVFRLLKLGAFDHPSGPSLPTIHSTLTESIVFQDLSAVSL